MDYCVIIFNPDHLWVVNSKAGISYYYTNEFYFSHKFHIDKLRMSFSRFATVVLHRKWTGFEKDIRAMLNIKNVRISKFIYSNLIIPLSYQASQYMLYTYPAPRPLPKHIIHIPPCQVKSSNKFIIDYIEFLRPPLRFLGLKYFTTCKGDWFLSIYQIDWSLLHLKRPTMNTLCALSAQTVNPLCVPQFLKEKVIWFKKQFLLKLIDEWRCEPPR